MSSQEKRFEEFCESQNKAVESLKAELCKMEEKSRLEANEVKAKMQEQERQISLMMSRAGDFVIHPLRAELNEKERKIELQERQISLMISRLDISRQESFGTNPRITRSERRRSPVDDDVDFRYFGFFSFLQEIGSLFSAGRTMFERSNNIRFHMHSVAAVVQDNPSKRSQQWLFAISSLILVLMQLCVLFWLAFDASHPPCATHTDCRVGEYCHSGFNGDSPFDTPRCTDCDSAGYMDYSDETSLVDDEDCSGVEETLDLLGDEINQNIVWMEGSEIYPQILNTNIKMLACIEHLYCKRTRINVYDYADGYDACDHLRLNMVRFGTCERLVFAFVAVLFAAILYRDIEEGTMEKYVLEYGLENRETILFPARIIRLALRIRRLILPWWVAAGSISIMISELLSMKNILLNFLAIAFITDADNLIGILLMTQGQKKLTEKFMDDMKLNHSIQVSTTWSKVIAITPAIMMYFSVTFMEDFVKFFTFGRNEGNCNGIEDALAIVFFNISPATLIVLHSIAQSLSLQEKTVFGRILRVMKEITTSFNALFLTWVWYILNYMWVSRDWKWNYLPIMIGFVLNSLFMLLLCHKKEKEVIIRLTVGYWLFLSGLFAWFYILHFRGI